jgi:hypothetical protein
LFARCRSLSKQFWSISSSFAAIGALVKIFGSLRVFFKEERMFSSRLIRLVAGSGALVGLSLPAAVVAAESVRAYVLVEAKPGRIEAALQSLKSLGNCLAMEHSLMNDEVVAHLDCDAPKYLSAAIANDIPNNEAVARVTILAVIKRQ